MSNIRISPQKYMEHRLRKEWIEEQKELCGGEWVSFESWLESLDLLEDE